MSKAIQLCISQTYGLLAVTGADATKFLQGQASCDILNIHKLGNRGAFCSAKGRLLATFYIRPVENGFWLRMTADSIDECMATLQRYVVFYSVELRNISAEYQLVFGRNLPASMAPWPHLSPFCDELQEAWLPRLEELTNVEMMPDSWVDLQFIRLGYLEIGLKWAGQFFPHNLGLQYPSPLGQQGISFSKGCYTGQEIIARTEHLGKVKKQLLRASMPLITELALEGVVMEAGKPVGQILLSSHFDLTETECLLVANRDARAPYIQVDNLDIPLTLLPLFNESASA